MDAYKVAVVTCVGINTVEAVSFSALPVAVPLLLEEPLRFIVGVGTPVVGLTGRGCTGAFLLPDLGIVGSIVVLRGRVIWTVLPIVIVSDQAALVSVSSIWRRIAIGLH